MGGFKRVLVAALLVAVASAAGCRSPERFRDHLTPAPIDAPAAVPAYDALITRYNANVTELDQVWSTAIVQARWVDERGRRQFEQGSGNFIYRRPHDVALTVGQLGQTALWAGSNADRYWLFDLRSDGEATFGRHANVGQPCSESLELPVNPRMVPHLMGLLPLMAAPPGEEPRVAVVNGYFVIDPPGSGLRLWLDSRSARPARIDMLDAAGEPALVAMLYSHEPVAMDRLEGADRPRIATHTNFYVMHDELDPANPDLIVELDVVNDGRRRDQVRDATFDLDRLLRAHRPATVRDLDAACD
ncbi:MAG: hypothetical protein WD009_01460 [Phycisphaeraceae bacterium]